ncbi:ALP1-like protein [Tanacetum coccineum]
MSDSTYSNTSVLDDMNDIELIMQAIKQDESLQQNEAESSRSRRNPFNRERDLVEPTVASYDLWIWHAFFEKASVSNDLTVLNNSSLFDDLLDGIAPVVPFEVNGVTFEKWYYLADGIYS